MEFRLLGPLEVLGDDGAPIPLGGKRPRALLALLLLHPNAVVLADRLIDGVWEEDPPASAQSALQVHVHSLRKTLGADRIVTHGRGYALRVDAEELDVERFERLVATGTRASSRDGARAVAWSCTGRVRRRAVRPRRRSTSRGGAPGRTRGSDRRGPRSGTPHRGRARARHARQGEPSPRALSGPAHACALPIRPSGRCACRVSRRPDGAGRPRAGAVSRAAHTRAADPPARSRARRRRWGLSLRFALCRPR